jgi:hypothetical protein
MGTEEQRKEAPTCDFFSLAKIDADSLLNVKVSYEFGSWNELNHQLMRLKSLELGGGK